MCNVIQNSNSRHVEPVEIFYGIPYAAPPVGARRFTVAQEPLAWVGTRLADTLPPVCPQQLLDITNVSATSKARLQQIRQFLSQKMRKPLIALNPKRNLHCLRNNRVFRMVRFGIGTSYFLDPMRS
ncbi:hypothetical protein J6590_082707 [Homalodisca vitripennis]|nr:hypothetical protein J6590_082707 [Homalodisca vitripennis]